MNRDAKILKLIAKIDSGNISSNEVARAFDRINKNSGETEIIYDVNDRADRAYYEELLANAKIGIYNRRSLVRMAELKYKGKSGIDKKKAYIIGSVVILAMIALIVIIAVGGES